VEFRFDADALFKPGEADDFFAARRPGLEFDPTCLTYSPVNAWWLAELSRLVYRQEAAEGTERSAGDVTRTDLLASVGLRERLFFHEEETCQGAVVESVDPEREPWSALVFRGTNSPQDWLANTGAVLGSWRDGGLVHIGFRDALERQWARIESALGEAPGPVFYAGHSLGGALATLAASRRPPLALYTFGSPRVGDGEFAASLKGVPVFRVVNNRDAVTSVPLPLPNLGFTHVGELRYFDHKGEPIDRPGDLAVVWDRLRWEAATDPGAKERSFLDLPKFLTDHSPANYVALLTRCLPQ
jgi:triacylglycerol lipase